MDNIVLAKTQYLGEYYLEFVTGFNTAFKKVKFSRTMNIEKELANDIQIKLVKGEAILLSAICHYGSYGVENGLWEIMPNHTPKDWQGDSVKGYLTFSEVIEYIDREIKLDK